MALLNKFIVFYHGELSQKMFNKCTAIMYFTVSEHSHTQSLDLCTLLHPQHNLFQPEGIGDTRFPLRLETVSYLPACSYSNFYTVEKK